jgi:hypothetical protein
MRTDMARESSAMPDNSELHFRAKVMAARHALVTVHATSRMPTYTDSLPDFDALRIRSDCRRLR